ncbi:MAG: HD domain-containing protein [Lactimicrobium sp.]|jgi:HD superfamily phosphohydrolase|uniref:HD domain-containing protein n=1 Tax=Lactimicrobium sp. TaxID=2563780 RepID=UPI002F356048
MNELLSLYLQQIPDYVSDLAKTKAMRRLQRIDMNCGMNCTSRPLFQQMHAYSRYMHSLGTALLAVHFHQSREAVCACLFHDISTPVFSHVIDFVHHDYIKQEYTEQAGRHIICNDPDIPSILAGYGIDLEGTLDYHRYPICDNASPQLSIDRLEYTLGNMINYGFGTLDEAQWMLKDLQADKEELIFAHSLPAILFAKRSLQCGNVYASDFDRYAMQILAEIVHDALQDGIVKEADLYTDEPSFIQLLCKDETYHRRWVDFCHLSAVYPSCREDTHARMVPAKKRWIDPYIQGKGRVSQIDDEMQKEIAAFAAADQNRYLSDRKEESHE